ncbi:MAG: type I DNA topoisomerase [Lachnospiraceae bacterium]|nr:type I DNA topoisomerase [Lachnospiraceae bacterium]
MAKNLVIVESPAKVKTIRKFLGANYDVQASGGHVRDLPKSSMGVDVEHDFEPKYITIRGKGDTLAMLRRQVKKADKIYLATDPDREGEAISWHLVEALHLPEDRTSRISFQEITKSAVRAAFKAPRKIDMDLVDAQQARRVLDRMVGYSISPLLWAKIKRGLSAGRVQSASLRMIADREAEIDAFVPEEYWSITAHLRAEKQRRDIVFRYYGSDNKKTDIPNETVCRGILAEIEKETFVLASVKTGERIRKAPLPFTTSTMQQEAAKLLGFSTSKTMRMAQQLYEGVEIKGQGNVALISYLRTDSTRISDEADAAVREYIRTQYGPDHEGGRTQTAESQGRVQDAHEAIRPTNVSLSPVKVKESLPRDLFRLYQLIWKRFVASRMADARYDTLQLRADAGRHQFTASGSSVRFEGFLSVYQVEDEEKAIPASGLKEGEPMICSGIEEKQHFTQPPAHFTEATLVHEMEQSGIGRPSTYAPTISTLLARHYVTKDGRNLFITELGEAVNDVMLQAFPHIVDRKFTAEMESELDGVEEGKVPWKQVIRGFYPSLKEDVARADEMISHIDIQDEVSDVTCELCGRKMVYKYGPHGKFLACPGFPDCRNTKPYYEPTDSVCPKCGGEILIKKTMKGRRYYGCSNYPECDYMSWQKPSAD